MANARRGTSATLPITVVIPAYNRPRETERAVASALDQRPRVPAEILVVDDGSADDTSTVAERAGATVIRHVTNRGLSAARNTGVREATQPWIALLDSDDAWLPHHLDELWRQRDGHVLVANSSLYLGPEPGKQRFNGPSLGRPLVLRTPAKLVYPVNFITPSAAMVRRDAVLEAGGFRSHHGVVEDFSLWLRVLETGTGIVTPRVGMLYHLHEGQMSNDVARMSAGREEAVLEHRARPWCTRGLVERWRGAAAWDHLRLALADGRGGEALRQAWRILGHPQRPFGVLGVLARRVMIRRRTAQLACDGTPSVAVLPGVADLSAARQAAGDRPLRDLRDLGPIKACAVLARRPAGRAVVSSRRAAAAVRLLGIDPVVVSASREP